MATEDDHRKQADHNQSFLDAIDQGRFPDWAATIAFYKAVHLVEMLFVRFGTPSGNHGARNGRLKRNYPLIWKEYRPLYCFSRMARYWCMKVDGSQTAFLIRRLGRVERQIEIELK